MMTSVFVNYVNFFEKFYEKRLKDIFSKINLVTSKKKFPRSFPSF